MEPCLTKVPEGGARGGRCSPEKAAADLSCLFSGLWRLPPAVLGNCGMSRIMRSSFVGYAPQMFVKEL